MLTAFSETHSIEEWSAIHGIPPDTIRSRLRRRWLPENAVTTPVSETKSLRMQAMGHAGAIARTARLSRERRRQIAQLASRALNGEPTTITASLNGEIRTGTILQWSEWSGIGAACIYMRLFELKGWSEQDAVTRPVQRKWKR